METTDPGLQDLIIRATNSQNRMASSSLRMTDQIHRDIEILFRKIELFYDRRKGYYRDQGKPIRKIISVNAVAQAAISILLQRPDDARARPGDYFKDDNRYKSIFGNDKIPLPAYLTCVQVVERVEQFLVDHSVERGDVKNLRFYVAAYLVRELTGIMSPPAEKLLSIGDASNIDEKIINDCYKKVQRTYKILAKKTDKDTVARGPELLKRLNAQSKRGFAKKKKNAEEDTEQ